MTDPKTAAILGKITADFRPMRIEVAPDLNESGMLEVVFSVKSPIEGTDTYTFHLSLNNAFEMAERLVLPFARRML